MRLATLLANVSDQELEALAIEHVRTDEKLPRPQLCNFLEGALRSYRFVSAFIINRQPPTFSLLTALLEAPGHELSRDGLSSQSITNTEQLAEMIFNGTLLARDDQLHLYRRALYEARRNDSDVNSSEAAMLAVLRREEGIAQVEHFLIEHHSDFREFWDRDDSYSREENALRAAGIIFHSNGQVVIPEEVAPAVWQTLGIDMPTACARRLFSFLSNSELADVLEASGSRTSGSKESRFERIILDRIQPRTALRVVGLTTLKELCRATDISATGNKDELIERIVAHFGSGEDQREIAAEHVPLPEPRRLDKTRFEVLFNVLLHQELSDILRRRPELRQSGTKDIRIRTIWEAQLSEATLLSELMNRQLGEVLERLGLNVSGSKVARIERIISHFGSVTLSEAAPLDVAVVTTLRPDGEQPVLTSELTHNQIEFRQKASNPQASLQPWLDSLLEAHGLIRCYATEDANPTKQLKNKLSQAAAARDGVLVLLLSDEEAYLKAREALQERWLTNAEWPKGVACVALAHPLVNPSITTIIERVTNPWSLAIRNKLFPDTEVLAARADETQLKVSRCGQCHKGLPHSAHFCPNCGAAVSSGET